MVRPRARRGDRGRRGRLTAYDAAFVATAETYGVPLLHRRSAAGSRRRATVFVALFREDAIWTTGHGKRLFGREAIAEFTAHVLPGSSAHGIATYDVEHVLFIRPDVAAVKVVQRYFTAEGAVESEGSPMYVVAKEDGRWLLTANQNTPVRAN